MHRWIHWVHAGWCARMRTWELAATADLSDQELGPRHGVRLAFEECTLGAPGCAAYLRFVRTHRVCLRVIAGCCTNSVMSKPKVRMGVLADARAVTSPRRRSCQEAGTVCASDEKSASSPTTYSRSNFEQPTVSFDREEIIPL